MCVNSEGSEETAWMRSVTWAFAGRLCDKYHNFLSWLLCLKGVDRKFRHEGMFGIWSRDLPSDAEQLSRVTEFSIRTKQPL